jgi:hypothetical protein
MLSDDLTIAVRVHRSTPDPYGARRSYFYYPAVVSPARAAALAAETCRAYCMTDVDYLEVFIGDVYPDGEDRPADLVADWQGRPAITINH